MTTPAREPLSAANRAIFEATPATLDRLYSHTVWGPQPVHDDTEEIHAVWTGDRTQSLRVGLVLVAASRLALYGYTGRLYARCSKLCAVPYCIRPDHWEWDKSSPMLRRETPPPQMEAPLPYFRRAQAQGMIHYKFNA